MGYDIKELNQVLTAGFLRLIANKLHEGGTVAPALLERAMLWAAGEIDRQQSALGSINRIAISN